MKVNDLYFSTHEVDCSADHAIFDCNNGYKLSIIRGGKFFCTTGDTYEVGIIDHDGNIEVFGYQTEEEVNVLLERYNKEF